MNTMRNGTILARTNRRVFLAPISLSAYYSTNKMVVVLEEFSNWSYGEMLLLRTERQCVW